MLLVLVILFLFMWVKHGSGRQVLKPNRTIKTETKKESLLLAQYRLQNDLHGYHEVNNRISMSDHPLPRDVLMDHTFSFVEPIRRKRSKRDLG
jgi:hypothetical protein